MEEKLKHFAKELEKRAEWWRLETKDPHGISVAMYVALSELAASLKEALK
jgi:hypothetical protein